MTGRTCISRIITELAVFDVDPKDGLTLIEHAEDVSVDDIVAKTDAPFRISPNLKPMEV